MVLKVFLDCTCWNRNNSRRRHTSVCEVLGIQDVVAKSLGSANPHNVLKACVNGLKSQNSPKILSAIEEKNIDLVLKREAK